MWISDGLHGDDGLEGMSPFPGQHRMRPKKSPPVWHRGAKSRERSLTSRRADNGGNDDGDGHGNEAEACCEGRAGKDHEDARKKEQERDDVKDAVAPDLSMRTRPGIVVMG